MKKIAIAVLAAASISGSVFAQGTVNYASFVPTYITAVTNATTYSPLFGGGVGSGASGATAITAGGFYYELLFTANGATQPTSLSALGTWTDSTYYAVNSASSAGRLSAGNGTAGSAVNGMLVGTTYSIMLAGWSANLGTTWAQAYATLNSSSALQAVSGNAFFGLSAVGYVAPTGTGSPGVTIFGVSPLINSPNTQLYLVPTTPVPEPSTLVLAGLGGLSLLAFRRKK